MDEFSKICPACQKNFKSLNDYMIHLKEHHKDLSPDKITEMGKEQKWKLRK